MITLRRYQQEAKAAIYEHLRTRSCNPLAVIPAGGGSTAVMASICDDAVAKWGGRILVLTPSDAATVQVALKLRTLCHETPIRIYPVGLKRIARDDRVTIASLATVGLRARKLHAFDVVMLAKAHLIRPAHDNAYRQFLADVRTVNPDTKMVGFSAMPYRIKTGSIVKAELICSENGLLNDVCFNVDARELIRDGYLCPLVTKAAMNKVDTELLPVYGGDFDSCAAGELIDQPELVEAHCAEIVASTHNLRSVLIFSAAGCIPGMRVRYFLRKYHGIHAALVDHVTDTDERAELASQFRNGKLKFLIVDDLRPSGFDVPNVDCLVMLRPTLSKRLYTYMVGWGLHTHPQKKNCLLLDFVGNALRHGPVDQIANGVVASPSAPMECCSCRLIIASGNFVCPSCGGDLRPPKHRRLIVAGSDLRPQCIGDIQTEYAVGDIAYTVHVKQGASAGDPKSMRVNYRVSAGRWQNEFICFEHSGQARQKAIAWWQQRSSVPAPSTAERAVAIAEGGGIAHTATITVRNVAGEKYGRIVAYELIVPRKSVPLETTSDEEEISLNAGKPT
jgi:DNA repair protein RadD